MRHLTGIVLAIVMTAALFGAATWGYVRFLTQSSRLAAGAAAVGMAILGDPVSTTKVVSIGLILCGVIGLNLSGVTP